MQSIEHKIDDLEREAQTFTWSVSQSHVQGSQIRNDLKYEFLKPLQREQGGTRIRRTEN